MVSSTARGLGGSKVGMTECQAQREPELEPVRGPRLCPVPVARRSPAEITFGIDFRGSEVGSFEGPEQTAGLPRAARPPVRLCRIKRRSSVLNRRDPPTSPLLRHVEGGGVVVIVVIVFGPRRRAAPPSTQLDDTSQREPAMLLSGER